MTNLSRIDATAPVDSNLVLLSHDLRRQRADLERQMREAEASADTTASLLERIEELRRRADELIARSAQTKR